MRTIRGRRYLFGDAPIVLFRKWRLTHEGFVRSAALCLLATIAAAQQRVAAQIQTHPLNHNGYSRPYLIYKPAHLVSHPAVVFMLGGIGSTAASAAQDYGWTEEADNNGFLVVFPDPVATRPDRPPDRKTNITFWEMEGSRTHLPAPGMLPVDDDGYLIAVLRDVLRREKYDHRRVFFAGFSSGSGMVQLFASRHSREVTAIAAVATPLMHPPTSLVRPIPILYIHGDEDEQFSGFEANSPNFATTPHGNWVTWGYLDQCHIQAAKKTDFGVQFHWEDCKNHAPVMADFIAGLGHEWPGSIDSHWNEAHRPGSPLKLTDIIWQFFSTISPK
jgi:polyhydroxybutyrate depolymerase